MSFLLSFSVGDIKLTSDD